MGHERGHVLLAGDVRGREVDRAAGLADLLGAGGPALRVHVAGDDDRPGLRERLGEDGATAPGGASDKDDLVGEVERPGSLTPGSGRGEWRADGRRCREGQAASCDEFERFAESVFQR